ncbi:MAG: allantoinase AllB [Gemmatimonadetes bacterium]|nr:allantoinase AllB [Gemmatimonadota bacterium]
MRPATLVIEDDRIASIESFGADESIDVGDLVVLPGLTDTHVHVNEPGRTEWEGFETASRAALSGGVTALVDMPLNSDPVTTTLEALEAKRAAAAARCSVDYGFWGGLVPGAVARLASLREAGALGFKAFTIESGIAEFPPVDRSTLRRAMSILADLDVPLLVHAEAADVVARATDAVRARLGVSGDTDVYADWLASRPAAAEAEAIAGLTELASSTGCHVHVVHVSSAAGVDRVRAAKECGAPLTAETCPHYLFFRADDVSAGDAAFKCAPPIRGDADRAALWGALRDETIDLVATDHSPVPERLKAGRGFFGAWGGIASLGLALSAVWTAGRSHDVEMEQLARWLGERPARLAGIGDRKGTLRRGADADLALFDPDAEVVVGPEHLRFRAKVSPYRGVRLRGAVRATFRRGRLAYVDPDDARIPEAWIEATAGSDGGSGMWLRPSASADRDGEERPDLGTESDR